MTDVAVLSGWDSWHATVYEAEEAECCTATGWEGLGSNQRWTSYGRREPVGESPAAGDGDEDSSKKAVEGEHVIVDSSRWL